jgi:hypothetical protein
MYNLLVPPFLFVFLYNIISRYRRNILEAKRNPDSVMSLVTDGADQRRSQCPYVGSQDSFASPLSVHIQGVKDHVEGTTLYRTFPNIPKGADLTIHCVLSSLEKWRERHQKFPEKLYIRTDGGSENINKYFLAFLEFLVIKRMIKEIQLSRNVPGHTHDDLDGEFGTISDCVRPVTLETIDSYKILLEEEFGRSSSSVLNIKVVDLWVIPDYRHFFEGCLDKDLSTWTKGIDGQLCWKFHAVPLCKDFPHGSCVQYKAHACDKVFSLFLL